MKILLQETQRVLKECYKNYNRVAIAFSGAEDIVLLDIVNELRLKQQFSAFFIDTGRHHPTTYEYVEQVRTKYSTLKLEVLFPEAAYVRQLVDKKGLFDFYKEGHNQCCFVRKVLPLQSKLQNVDIWLTGQRRDQNSSTRGHLKVWEKKIPMKCNPLLEWTNKEVWTYIRDHQVITNPLHDQGYKSIGCAPCTRPVKENDDEREGRWWWEPKEKKECGLHTVISCSPSRDIGWNRRSH